MLNWTKLTLILEKLIGLIWLKFTATYFLRIVMMSRLSYWMGMGGIWEMLGGKIWEWDLSFRWELEWQWSHWNGREFVRTIYSRTSLQPVAIRPNCTAWFLPKTLKWTIDPRCHIVEMHSSAITAFSLVVTSTLDHWLWKPSENAHSCHIYAKFHWNITTQ